MTEGAEIPNRISSQLRERRKWQIALRRYVLEKQKSTTYAPYFALDIEKFRQWIALQFSNVLSWENFSQAWQFDHVVPVSYFDFNDNNELKLCWNFTNIRVQPLQDNNHRRAGIDLMAAKAYFQSLYEQSQYTICAQMIRKIEQFEQSEVIENKKLGHFLSENKDYIEAATALTKDDFLQLNAGKPLRSLLYEKEFLKKYGA